MSITFINILNVDIKIQMEVRNWRNNDSIREYMVNDHIITKEEHKNWLNSLEKANKNIFFIAYFNDKIIGVTSIINPNYIDKVCSWGQYLNPEYMGLGLGFFLEYFFLNYIFDNFEFEKVNSEIFSNNVKNIKLHGNLGFVLESKNEIIREGEEKINMYYYSILKTDWQISCKKLEEKAKKIPLVNNNI